jgi:hypothetical protein
LRPRLHREILSQKEKKKTWKFRARKILREQSIDYVDHFKDGFHGFLNLSLGRVIHYSVTFEGMSSRGYPFGN